MRTTLDRILRSVTRFRGQPDDDNLTATQSYFVQWNAERLGISLAQSRQRYAQSRAEFRGGHSGSAFRLYNDQAYRIYGVFFNDSPTEVFGAYQAHAPMHFLRMLSYQDVHWDESEPIFGELRQRSSVRILDFGCGLAQRSRALAKSLRNADVDVELILVDIDTLRSEFLLWLGKQTDIPTRFLACTPSVPIPELPAYDVGFVLEFFEHVHDPMAYFRKLHDALTPGGYFLTDISDHEHEFMHVSPDLNALRVEVGRLGYTVIDRDRLIRKPALAVGPD